MKVFLIFIATVAMGNCELQLVSEWNAFKKHYNKQYKPMENNMRKNNYYRNKERIASHNFLYDQGVYNYKLGLNQFADWTEQEFYNIFKVFGYGSQNSTNRWIGATVAADPPQPYRAPKPNRRPRSFAPYNIARDQTVMGKSQCNAGWAFAAVAAMEGHDAKYPAGLQQYSEQHLIDCISKELGCTGLSPSRAFEYVIEKGNINPLKKYPYEGNASDCRYNEDEFGTSGVEIITLPPNNEEILSEIVREEGPIVIGFDPMNFSFMFYKSGIYDEKKCRQTIGNQLHFMALVGFDEDAETQTKYWIVRNSFGETWGESGNIRVPMDVNMCGLAYQPIYLKI